jgi:NADH-quinone oxidoreductase subunit C
MSTSTLLNTVQEKLSAQFGDDLLSSELVTDYPTFVVKKNKLAEVIKYLYVDDELAFQYLTTMAGLHFPENKGEELGMMYQLHNLHKNYLIRIKCFFSINDASVSSITSIFPGANWMERQEYDFFGIKFIGHPNLKRILNIDDMDYFPMRKEYALEDDTRVDKNDEMFGR